MRKKRGSAVLSVVVSAVLAVSLCPALALADEVAGEGQLPAAAEQPTEGDEPAEGELVAKGASESVGEGEATSMAEPAAASVTAPLSLGATPAAVSSGTIAPAYDWYGDGSATEFTISTAADLLGFANVVNGSDGKTAYDFAGRSVGLSSNINLAGVDWSPIGTQNGSFSGTFDGRGFAISNVSVVANSPCAGLFGCISSSAKDTSATVKNLVINGVSIQSSSGAVCAGALVGSAERVFVEGVSVSGVNISALGMTGLVEIAGLIGDSSCVVATDCSVDDLVVSYEGSGSAYAGGLTSYVNGHSSYWTAEGASINSLFECCEVSNSLISCNQSPSAGKIARTGGFAVGCTGYNGSHNTYKNCKALNVDITCTGDGQHIAGGFMAANSGLGSDSNCEATGAITYSGSNADSIFGGFIGQQGGRGRIHSGHTVDVDIVANGTVGGFVGKTVQYLLESDHANHYVFEDCTANGTVGGNVVGGFAGEVGCYGGDGHQVWVDFTNCTANGNVAGDKAAGFLGAVVNKSADFTNSERSGVTLTSCVASGTVSGSSAAAGMIADIANKNSENGVSTLVTLVDCISSPVVTGLSEDTRVSIDCVLAAEEGLYNESVISIDVTQGTLPPEDSPLPPAGDDGADGIGDDGASDVKPVAKVEAVAKSLAKTGDSTAIVFAGLSVVALAAVGACAVARRRAE